MSAKVRGEVQADMASTRSVVAQERRDTPTLSAEAYKALQAKQTTEAQFQRALVKTARDYGFALVYHTKFSIGSDPGFPDLVLVNETGRCVVVECKRVGKEPTEKQREWLRALGRVPGVETYCWTAGDWDTIHDVLGRDWARAEGGGA